MNTGSKGKKKTPVSDTVVTAVCAYNTGNKTGTKRSDKDKRETQVTGDGMVHTGCFWLPVNTTSLMTAV